MSYEDSRARAWAQLKGNATPWSVDLVNAAEIARDYLIDHNYFTPKTKDAFALTMGWVVGNPPNERPDRGLVERICNLTRDVESVPEAYPDWVITALGGYVIAYAPNEGGMTLIGEGADIDSRMFIHILVGDLQRQQTIKTMNRRRLPTWKKTAQSFADSGDIAMARLLFQVEDEIAKQGVVDDHLVGEVYRTARELGLIER